MKTWPIQSLVIAGVFALVNISRGADQASTNVPATSAQAAQADPQPVTKPEPKVSKSVADVAKLSKAGLEPRVIETYLDQSGAVVPPTADEVIYLKDQGVPQEVIASMIKRGGSARSQLIQSATKEDRTWESMLDARQRSMFARDYPPVVVTPYVHRPTVVYPAYGVEGFGSPAVGYVYRANPPRRAGKR